MTLYPASAGVLIEVLARLHAGVHVLEQSGRCVIEKQIISDQEVSVEVLRWCKMHTLTHLFLPAVTHCGVVQTLLSAFDRYFSPVAMW